MRFTHEKYGWLPYKANAMHGSSLSNITANKQKTSVQAAKKHDETFFGYRYVVV